MGNRRRGTPRWSCGRRDLVCGPPRPPLGGDRDKVLWDPVSPLWSVSVLPNYTELCEVLPVRGQVPVTASGVGWVGRRATPNQPLQPPHTSVTRLAVASRAPAGGRLNGGVMQTQQGVKVEDEGRGFEVHRPCNWEAGSAGRHRGRRGDCEFGKGSGAGVVSRAAGRNGSSYQPSKQGCVEGERSLHNRRLQWTGHTAGQVRRQAVSRGRLVQWQE